MNSPAHAGTEWGRLSAIYREAHYNFLPLGQRFCNSLANFTSSSVHCGIPTVFDIFLNGFGDRLIAQARPSRRERFHFHNRAGHQCRAFARYSPTYRNFLRPRSGSITNKPPDPFRVRNDIGLYSAVGYGAMTAVDWQQMFAQFVEPDIH